MITISRHADFDRPLRRSFGQSLREKLLPVPGLEILLIFVEGDLDAGLKCWLFERFGDVAERVGRLGAFYGESVRMRGQVDHWDVEPFAEDQCGLGSIHV